MLLKSEKELNDLLKGVLKQGEKLEVLDEGRLRKEIIDRLVYNAVFSPEKDVADGARHVIEQCAVTLGAYPASIQGLYDAMGRGEVSGFTVPAVNIRGLTFDIARALFRAAKKNSSAAFIFEIAKSEIDYTMQRPAEFAACVLAAAIKENYKGPVFIQGDHFQVNAKKYSVDKSVEIIGLKALIKEALEAGFMNIDIDASTVVDLSRAVVSDQQKPNYEITAALTVFIRGLERPGVTVSIGGEIGEVGGKNSTPEELKAFMDGYLGILGGSMKGISKISIQTGTSHGGIVLPDGSIAKVKVDFDTIEKLSAISRKDYGLAGVVQHGASTLPDDAFDIFTKKGAAEVHLATGFQNLVYESPSFPAMLKEDMYSYLRTRCASEKKEGETDEQFIYKTRKKAFGPFKEKVWNMPKDNKAKIGAELEDRFDLIFKKLNAGNTMGIVKKWVPEGK